VLEWIFAERENTMTGSRGHRAAALLIAVSLAVSPLCAQQAQSPPPATTAQTDSAGPASAPVRKLQLGPDYSKGRHWLPDFTLPYRPKKIPEPVLTNSPDIAQFIQDGKLMIGLEDAISLALKNNLNIAVARYTPWLDETNLLYAKSGANGLTKFDPVLTSTIEQVQFSTPINQIIVDKHGNVIPPGSATGHTTIANAGYSQGFATGTTASVSVNTTRESSNLPSFFINPWVQSNLTIQINQPLLAGFGRIANTRYIIEAKNTVKVGEWQFAQQAISTVTQVSNDYWELVFAGENVKVEEMSVGTDEQLYENNKKQLEIGTMAPLDVVTAESQLASDQQQLVQAQTTQLQDETALLNDITKDPLAASLAGVEIVPTTPITTPDIESISIKDAVAEAWQKRPELQEAALNLKNAGVEVKATKNGLLPSLNLFGEYQAVGLAGTPTTNVGTPGGLGTDLQTMIDANNPTIEGGVTLTLPIRNRAAQGLNAVAILTERQQEAQYRQEQNTIFLNVRNTLIALEQDRAAVAAAGKARDLAQQSYDAEVKKFQLGSSTSFNVVLKQQQLTSAEGIELRDRTNLIEAEVNFNQAMGRTLDVNNISVADARTGNISRVPNIPGAMDAGASTGGKASQ
jgi:outer membrane protein